MLPLFICLANTLIYHGVIVQAAYLWSYPLFDPTCAPAKRRTFGEMKLTVKHAKPILEQASVRLKNLQNSGQNKSAANALTGAMNAVNKALKPFKNVLDGNWNPPDDLVIQGPDNLRMLKNLDAALLKLARTIPIYTNRMAVEETRQLEQRCALLTADSSQVDILDEEEETLVEVVKKTMQEMKNKVATFEDGTLLGEVQQRQFEAFKRKVDKAVQALVEHRTKLKNGLIQPVTMTAEEQAQWEEEVAKTREEMEKENDKGEGALKKPSTMRIEANIPQLENQIKLLEKKPKLPKAEPARSWRTTQRSEIKEDKKKLNQIKTNKPTTKKYRITTPKRENPPKTKAQVKTKVPKSQEVPREEPSKVQVQAKGTSAASLLQTSSQSAKITNRTLGQHQRLRTLRLSTILQLCSCKVGGAFLLLGLFSYFGLPRAKQIPISASTVAPNVTGHLPTSQWPWMLALLGVVLLPLMVTAAYLYFDYYRNANKKKTEQPKTSTPQSTVVSNTIKTFSPYPPAGSSKVTSPSTTGTVKLPSTPKSAFKMR